MADLTFTIDVDANDAINSAKNLQDEIKDLFTKPTSGKLENQLDRIKLRLNKILTQQEKAKTGMDQVLNQDFGNTHAYQRVLDKIELYNGQIEAAKKNVADLDKKAPGSEAFNTAVAQLRRYKEWLNLYSRLQTRMEQQGKAKVDPKDTQEFKNYVNQIENGNNEMRTLVSSFNELLGLNNEVGSQAESNTRKTEKRFENLIKIIKKIPGALANGVKALGKFGSRILGINKESDKHNLSLKKILKQTLKWGLGIRSVFILWRKLRAYTQDALKLMATQFEEVDADVSMLMNSFNAMKLSMGTMAQPLMHALAPALVYIIDLISAAATALANFFAIITGQSYIYKAKKADDSYADSIKGVGSAAKEANKELAEYDNLLVIDQPKDSGGDGSGAAEDLTGTFEKTAAESDLAKIIKEAIAKGDWEGVGSEFADKLNIITERFDDWVKKFRPKSVKWAQNIGRILGGFIDGWDADLLGRTVGDTVMAFMDTVATWWETVPWKKLGGKIADAVNGLVDTIEPETVGRFFAGKINAIIDFAAGLVDPEKGIKWEQLGSKLGESLKNLIQDIHWDTLGADLTNLASGILTGLSSFIVSSQLGITVGNAINEFLNGIDFAQLATDLSDCAKNIIGAIANFIETVDWYEVGKAIADLLTNIDWLGLIVELGKVALALIKGLGKALLGLASNPEALADIGTALIAIFGAKWLWGKITGLFSTNIAGAISGGVTSATGGGLAGKVSGALSKFFSTSVGKVVGAIGAGYALFEFGSSLAGSIGSVIATAFGDDEMAAEYQKMSHGPTKYLIEAADEIGKAATEYSQTTGGTTLGNAISDMLTGGPDTLDKANKKAKEISDSVNETFQRAQYSYDVLGLHELVSDEEWEKFKNSCDNYVEEINRLQEETKKSTKDVKDSLDSIPTSAKEAMQKAAQETSEGTENITESVHVMANGIPSDVEEAMKKTEKAVTQTFNGMPSDVQEKVQETKDTVVQTFNGMPSDVQELMQQTRDDAVQTFNGMPSEVQELMQQTKDNTVESFNGMPSDVQELFAQTKEGIKEEFNEDSIKPTFEARAEEVVTSFNGMPSDVQERFAETLSGAKQAFAEDSLTNHFTSVKDNIEGAFTDLPTFFGTTFEDSWNTVQEAFSNGSTVFGEFNTGISDSMTTTVNGLITGLNSVVSKPFQAINDALSRLRNLKFGASSVFSSLPIFSNIPSIPKLAQGAVIPPNREFLAMLGDQSSGTNIETPLATMIDAFKTALADMNISSNNAPVVLQLNSKVVAQAVWDEEDKKYKQTGRR